MIRSLRLALVLWAVCAPAGAQPLGQRGFVDTRGSFFPQDAPNDPENGVVDFLVREEGFFKPSSWIQFAAGVDLRASSHGQVESAWRLDISDRRTLRPALSVRRLSATVARGPLTVDLGRQFIRWGKADIVTPTDRFAPRDFLNVIDSEFLGVVGARGVLQIGSETVDVVWVPRFTPSRTPLLGQRWTAVPAAPGPITLSDAGALLPSGSQTGVRWSHTGGYEYSVSFFDGFNHLPNVDAEPVALGGIGIPLVVAVTRTYPTLRMYGADAAVPTRWFTLKGEAAYFTSSTPGTDEYVLYVVQLERQTGEWLLLGGYAGEAVTRREAAAAFAPDRGLTRSITGRASYTIDPNRSAALETAIRQNGRGVYVKGEYSETRGGHWRATMAAALIRGDDADFLGQYRRNSNLSLALRYSF